MGGRNEQVQFQSKWQSIAAFTASKRNIDSVQHHAQPFQAQQPTPGTVAVNETDSNADTCCLGCNHVVLEHTMKKTDVHPCDPTMQPLHDVPIVTGATACDDPVTKQTFVLIIDEASCCGTKLDHSLLNPNQLRSCGVPH